LFTTDLIGTDGADPYLFCIPSDPNCPNSDLSDYVFYNQFVNMDGFSGTSASAPEISGIAALILSANPALSYRDVQQILILSSRHFDFADPDLTTNGAGFVVSHNDGFGVPDAGQAVQLARSWSNRPPLSVFSLTDTQPAAIPDDALRVEISGDGVPPALASISARPDVGVQPDSPTASLPLVDVGLATNVPAINLTNKAALILRGVNNFIDKISNAAAAGAAFVIVYNTNGDDNLIGMGATDYAPIPAVIIGNTDGEALKSLFATNSSARARIHLQTMDKTFHVNTALSCEQVGVRVQSDHPARGQLRITLLSPQGTRSVLQPYNIDPTPGPVDWTYWSTHHFFEGSAGDWKVSFADEVGGSTGSVHSVTLVVRGTQITDVDHDGLDDAWEMAHLGSLTSGPKDDPDGDGAWNAREQLTGTDPAAIDHPLAITFSWWDLSGTKLARLTWPSAPQYVYQLFGGTNLSSLSLITNMPGRFPETEWLGPVNAPPGAQFYKLFSHPAP
jgi:subtilisin-like proprotein convertase family protein